MSTFHFAGRCSNGGMALVKLEPAAGNEAGEFALSRTLLLDSPCPVCGEEHLSRVTASEYELFAGDDDG